MRAGRAGSVGSISGRVKRKETPVTADSGGRSDSGFAAGDHAPYHRVRCYGSRRLVVDIAAAWLVSCCRRPTCFFCFSRCAITVASYRARCFSQLSSAVCLITPRGAGCSPRKLTWPHHRGGLPYSEPHPQLQRRRGTTPMVTIQPRILVSIRLTLLIRLPRREFMGELSTAEHRRLPGRQSGTVT